MWGVGGEMYQKGGFSHDDSALNDLKLIFHLWKTLEYEKIREKEI